ncbi:MAG TPA: elongation factor G, partial [Bacilli bacterium]|nr:elongation factor G [Bacilli bacterium]
AFTWPIGDTNDFRGFVNLLNKTAVLFNGISCVEGAIPRELASKVDEVNGQLIEKVAETSEELMEKYFSGEELTAEEIRKGLKIGISAAELFPILVGSGLNDVGVDTLLDMIVDFLPSPSERPLKVGLNKNNEEATREMSEKAPLAGYIFKTTIDPFIGTISFFKLYAGSLKAGQEVYIPATGNTVKIAQIFTIMGKNQLPMDVVNAGDIACVAKVNEFYNGLTFSDKKDQITYPKIEHSTPIIYVAIQPKNKNDEDKLSGSLQKLKLEDETFEIVRNPETSQQLIGGQGMTHIGYILEKMKNMFKVEIETSDPKIVYRETIKVKGEAQGRHKKQSGGAGQFGDVWIRFEPCKEDFIFAEEVVGGSVPKNYFPAVEKGLIETLEHGPLVGFPVIGVKATLYYGSYHQVDSNELSFKLAAGLAFKNAIDKIKPTILEPICEVSVTVKDEFVGDIMGDMTKRRGRVLGMEQGHGMQTIIADVPEAEIIKYATDLKAMTQASGRFTRKFVRYDEVPELLIKKITEEYKKEK